MAVIAPGKTRRRSPRAGSLLGGLMLALLSGDGLAQERGPGPATVAKPTPESERAAAALGIGRWIWTTNFAEKQVCRLWRSFSLPATNTVRKASLHITADNLYRLYLDGREIGQGGNWRSLTDYDVTWLLGRGPHVLAVEALNDGLEGGLILGLNVEFMDGGKFELRSDKSWYVVPNEARRWLRHTIADPHWPRAQEVGVLGQFPWWLEPVSIVMPQPLRPEVLRFWQTGWFLAVVLSVAGVALVGVCDPEGRLIVLYRDNFGSNGLTIVHSLPYARDPQRTNWTTIDLTTANLGNYEPVIDHARWALDNQLHIVYQPSQGEGYTPPANTAAQIGVVEWNAAAYFAHRPTMQFSFLNETNASLAFNAQLGWGYRVQTSTNLTDWATLATLAGVSGQLQYTHTNSVGENQRYWRLQSQEGGFAP